MLPHARQEQLVVQEVMDETLIYDLRTHQAHCLNRTAALVWRSCDGKTTLAGVANRLRQNAALAGSESVAVEEMVALAIQQLEAAGLVNPLPAASAAARISRREVARRLGTAGGIALLVPAITSIVAPTAAMAASQTCIPNGKPCTIFDTCCSGKACDQGSSGRCN